MSEDTYHYETQALEGFNGLDLEFQKFINFDKQQLKQAVDNVKSVVDAGEYDPLKALIYANKLKALGADLEKVVRPIAEGNVHLAKGERYNTFSVEVTQKETGVSYDYSSCGDKVWNELSSEVELKLSELKQREELLKTITKPIEMVDTDTGETYTVNPPVRKGKLGLNLSIK